VLVVLHLWFGSFQAARSSVIEALTLRLQSRLRDRLEDRKDYVFCREWRIGRISEMRGKDATERLD
jgi:hypothetical protein